MPEHFNSSFCLLASYVCTCFEIETNSHVDVVNIEILQYLNDLLVEERHFIQLRNHWEEVEPDRILCFYLRSRYNNW